jgi:hypothetical protein
MSDFIAKTEIGRNHEDKAQEQFGLKLGLVVRIDEINMKVDLKIMSGGGEAMEVDLTQAMAGPRSFWGGIPEKGSICIIGYRKKSKQIAQAMILGYIPTGVRAGLKMDPISPVNPAEVDPADAEETKDFFGPTIRHRRLKLSPGDVGGLSSSGSEFAMGRDVRLINRAGDSVELRDADRTLITSTVHRLDSTAGVFEINGPIRRGGMYLPSDVTKDGSLVAGYKGNDVLTNSGPGGVSGGYKFAGPDGKVLEFFNNVTEFPPVTYTNGRRVFYPATNVAVNFEDPESGGASAYTEHRMEIAHTTDCTQEVREEIDGFQLDRNRIFIEQVYGTIVGNDTYSTEGLRQYGKLLKPIIFDDLFQLSPGKFRFEEIPRGPHEPDLERDTTTGAYLFKVKTLRKDKNTEYAHAVSKQGKVFLNIPGSTIERYPCGAKNVSAEVNLEGALKLFIGAETSRNASVILKMVGGITGEIGHLTNGKAVDVKLGSSIDFECAGTNDEDNMAYRATINGNSSSVTTGEIVVQGQSSISHTASGAYNVRADAINHSGTNGITGNYGGMNLMSTSTAQFHYAQAVLETIVSVGYTRTILVGALTDTILLGPRTYLTGIGAVTWISPLGAYSTLVGAGVYSVTVGLGAIVQSVGGLMSMNALIMALTSAGPLSLTSASIITIAAPTVMIGPGPLHGVVRGKPLLPPNLPSRCPASGEVIPGSLAVLSA